MCGRFGYTEVNKEKVKKAFRLKKINTDLIPRYNITPGQNVPVVLNSAPDELNAVRWGLVPSWAKEEKIGTNMINARAETITEKPSFRGPVNKHRCLILCTHFFEWKKAPDGKQPYCLRLKTHEPFALAGIWDHWEKGEAPLKTCSIITCAPNALMKDIHDRMPVILDPKDYATWLSDAPSKEVVGLLKSFAAKDMEGYAVSKRVNAPANDTEEILDPLT